MKTIALLTIFGGLLMAQTPVNQDTTVTGKTNMVGGTWRAPESTFAGLPSVGASTGLIYVVTDATSVGNCSSGGGSSRSICRSTGSIWEPLGGGGSSASQVFTCANSIGTCTTGFRGATSFVQFILPYSVLTSGLSTQEVKFATTAAGYVGGPLQLITTTVFAGPATSLASVQAFGQVNVPDQMYLSPCDLLASTNNTCGSVVPNLNESSGTTQDISVNVTALTAFSNFTQGVIKILMFGTK